jgi:hypothetical protein
LIKQLGQTNVPTKFDQTIGPNNLAKQFGQTIWPNNLTKQFEKELGNPWEETKSYCIFTNVIGKLCKTKQSK